MNFFFNQLLKFLIFTIIFIMGFYYLVRVITINRKIKFEPNITVVLLGHSHSETGVNDSIIPSLKNLSNGGESFFYTYQKLKLIVNDNENIKNIILTVTNNQLDSEMDEWTLSEASMLNYYPRTSYFVDNDDILFLLKNNPLLLLKAERKSFYFHFENLVFNRNLLKNGDFGNYLSLTKNEIPKLEKEKYLDKIKNRNFEFTKYNITYLKKIVSFCQKKNIKLYFIRTPIHSKRFIYFNETLFQQTISNFGNIPFLDYHNLKFEDKYFADYEHLNKLGAQKFSEILRRDLINKKIIKIKNK